MKVLKVTQARRNFFKVSMWSIAIIGIACIPFSLWIVLRPESIKTGTSLKPATIEPLAVEGDTAPADPPRSRVVTPALPGSGIRTLSSDKFRARYGARVERREVEAVLRTLEDVRNELKHRTESAEIQSATPAQLDIVIHDTTGDFVAATGLPWWAAAVTHDNLIELQPLEILRSRGVLNQTLRHEYAHCVIDLLSHGRAPRWLAEGFAAHIAGEGAMLLREQPTEQLSVEELEMRLAKPGSAEEMRSLYAAAFREVSALIRTEGEASVWRRVAQN